MLAILMVLSAVGCGNTSAPENNNTESDVTTSEPAEETTTTDAVIEGATTEAPTTDAATTEEATTDPLPEADIDEGKTFKTGYSRVVITPPKEELGGQGYLAVYDDIYATCLAVNDGEETAIFISLDIQDLMETGNDQIRSKVSAVTKVPTSNIFISVTHNHSAQLYFGSSLWAFNMFTDIANSAKEALDDLSDTKMFVGTGKTTGMAFVRRYTDASGIYTGETYNLDPATARSVTEADDTVQVVRFVREDKKDIILSNWQAHLAHAIVARKQTISADIVRYLREDIESKDDDALVIFFSGASGNINLTAPSASLKKYRDYVKVAHALADVILEVATEENLTRIGVGKINISKQTYQAKNADDPADVVAAARARLAAGGNDVEDRYIDGRNKNDYTSLRMSAISIGDLALITVPYEMFDTNGMQIKKKSPFKMTIVITNSDGAWAYMPSYEAFTVYGGYETIATYFSAGMGEELADEYIKMLDELSKK